LFGCEQGSSGYDLANRLEGAFAAAIFAYNRSRRVELKSPSDGFLQTLKTGALYLSMRLTISGLPRQFDKFDLQRLFNPFGWVEYTKIIIDPLSGLSKGRGIVEMQDDQAKQAMAALQGKVLGTNPLNIKEAKERGPRPE
jgi:RNA recognition motif-containing protein